MSGGGYLRGVCGLFTVPSSSCRPEGTLAVARFVFLAILSNIGGKFELISKVQIDFH